VLSKKGAKQAFGHSNKFSIHPALIEHQAEAAMQIDPPEDPHDSKLRLVTYDYNSSVS